MQKTAHKKNKAVDKFLTWLNKNGAVFPNIYFQTYKNDERGVHARSFYSITPNSYKNSAIYVNLCGDGREITLGKKSFTKFNWY